ncbi:hypothetical protein SBA4_1640006 [Candidatus Sulfopaludibacter sp. SbA4]|nr:hypothetical protein SBA4_1640006 [Candidatus Sulfopaludibacter sp. SbA4]
MARNFSSAELPRSSSVGSYNRHSPNRPVKADSASDGMLEAREILDLDLHAELAVLSACETARGETRSGEGLVGMGWAVIMAGTPSVVVSQWKVDSASTAQLMLAFHRDVQKGLARPGPLQGQGRVAAPGRERAHPYAAISAPVLLGRIPVIGRRLLTARLRIPGGRERRKRRGRPGWTRTSDPQLRRLMLYPPELRARLYEFTAL